MSKRVQALALLHPEVNAREFLPISHDVMKVVVSAERQKRRSQCEEHLSMICFRTALSQIVCQRLADFFGQRQTERREGLRLRDLYGGRFPLQIIKFQCSYILHSQSQATCQQENRVIALALGRAAIHGIEQLDQELWVPNRWNCAMLRNADRRQHWAEIPLQDSSQQEKLQKAAHIGDDPRDGPGCQTMLRGNERTEIGRLPLIEYRGVP